MIRHFGKLAAHRRGATAIEYGLILGLIAIAIVGSVSLIGSRTAGALLSVSNQYPDVQP
jgi:pilus assembly protein Flp/PilA